MVQILRSPLTFEQAMAGKTLEMERNEHGPDTVWLVDARRIYVELFFVERWAKHLRETYPELTNPGALLVSAPVATALAALITRREARHRRGAPFSTVAAAVEWLGRDPAVCTAVALGLKP